MLAGRYAVEEEIATGGMASVWRATDQVLGRHVAVKVLHRQLADDPAFVERFNREALAAARLTHPNIVNVFDTGSQDGTSYIVMELFEGETLRDVLARDGPLDPERAVGILVPVLAALASAHEAGVIHRDVKPANILVGRGGRVKVADFGIAKAAYAESEVTTTGAVLGSVPYLSPEQVQGSPIDARADLYASGVVLYELLTGRVPFRAETHLAAAMMRLTTDPMPPRSLRPGIPRKLEAVVMRALARRPDARFSSAQEMAAALRRVPAEARSGSVDATAAPAAGRSVFRTWMLVPLIVLVLAGVAVAAGLSVGVLELGGPLGVQPAEKEDQAAESASPEPWVLLPIAGVSVLDPATDGENDDEAPLAIDGNDVTFWRTENYNVLDITLLKDGVGLLFDLGETRTVSGFRLLTPHPGFDFLVLVGDNPGELRVPRESFRALPNMRRAIGPVDGRYVLLWITSVVDTGEGNRATVAEFKVFAPGG
jgi:serine/threonine-protein kinase